MLKDALKITFLLAITLNACVNPQKAFEAGAYEKAYKQSLRKVQKDKDDIATLKVLRDALQKIATTGNYDQAYELAMEEFRLGLGNRQTRNVLTQSLTEIMTRERALIITQRTAESPNDWEKALATNVALQNTLLESDPYMDGQFEAERLKLEEEYEQDRANLYTHYLTEGQEQLAQSDSTKLKIYARKAHSNFKKAKAFVDTPSDSLQQLITTAFGKGIVNYYVESDDLWMMSYSWEIDRIFEDIAGQNGFTRVVYERTMNDIDCKIELDFQSVDIDMDTDKSTDSYEEKIITGYDVEVDTSGNEIETPIYKTVEGQVRTITETRTITVILEMDVQRRTPNCKLSDDRFERSARSSIKRYEVSGDERAIPDRFLEVDEEEFEDEDDVVEALLERLYDEVSSRIY